MGTDWVAKIKEIAQEQVPEPVQAAGLLQPAGTQRCGPRGDYRGARLVGSGEPEFDFTLDHQRHVVASAEAHVVSQKKKADLKVGLYGVEWDVEADL